VLGVSLTNLLIIFCVQLPFFCHGNHVFQEDEIRIAKEIEAGVFEIMQAITLYPVITEKFLSLR
jgi:hypothetical protein